MRRDRALIVSIAAGVIAWVVGRRFAQQFAQPYPAVPDDASFSPTFFSGDADLPASAAADVDVFVVDDLDDTLEADVSFDVDAVLMEEPVLFEETMLIDALDDEDATPSLGDMDEMDMVEAIDEVDDALDLPSGKDTLDDVAGMPVDAVSGMVAFDVVDELSTAAVNQGDTFAPVTDEVSDNTFAAAMDDTSGDTFAAGTDTAASDATATSRDDLTVIEGIGPKISSILINQGITTFAQLVDADVAELSTMLRNVSITTANPTTWPQQARLALNGDWDGLKELQGRIKNGRLTS